MKFLALFVLSLSLPALASTGAGNGGISVVCRDSDNKIISAELLEIYEGKTLYQKTYDHSQNNLKHILSAVEDQLKVSSIYIEKYQKEMELIHKNIIFVPKGHKIELTEDALPVISQKNCRLEQLANYTPAGDVLISQEIYESLDILNKAALYVHEAVYAVRRHAKDTTSVRTRRLVRELMAINQDHSFIKDELAATIRQMCPTEEFTQLIQGELQADLSSMNDLENNISMTFSNWAKNSVTVKSCLTEKKKKKREESCKAALHEWSSLNFSTNSLIQINNDRAQKHFASHMSKINEFADKYFQMCGWESFEGLRFYHSIYAHRSLYADEFNRMMKARYDDTKSCTDLMGISTGESTVKCLLKAEEDGYQALQENKWKQSYLDALLNFKMNLPI